MTKEEMLKQFDEWIKQAELREMECRVNLAVAMSNVETLKKERATWASSSPQE